MFSVSPLLIWRLIYNYENLIGNGNVHLFRIFNNSKLGGALRDDTKNGCVAD